MKLAVVTVTYNSGSVLEEFLHCCEIQDFRDYVLVVVDNNSQDDSIKIARFYEEKLNQKEKAMEMYRNYLEKFPGTIYVAEARKRFRALRGDKLN